MKTFTLILAIACLLMGSSCEVTERPEEVTCEDCTGTTVTVEVKPSMCGNGAWKNLWLWPTDTDSDKSLIKKWLQPYSIKGTLEYQPKAGDILRITYEPATPDHRYDGVVTCAAYPGPSTPVHIKCIAVISAGKPASSSAASAVTAEEVTTEGICNGVGALGETWLKTATGQYLQPYEINKELVQNLDIRPGDKLLVSYEPVGRDSRYDNTRPEKACFAPVPASTAVRITSVTKIKR